MMRALTHGSRAIWIAVAVSLLVGLVALAPGALGVAHGQTAGPPPTPTPQGPPAPTTVTLPPTGGSVDSPSAKVTITVPALGKPIVVVLLPVVAPSNAPAAQQATLVQQTLQSLNIPAPTNADGSAASVAQLFQLNAADEATGADVGTFAQPVTIDVDVSPETLALAGGNLANLTLAYFDTATGTWVPVPCSPAATGISCLVTHFSLWALIVRTAPIAGVPPATVPGAPAPSAAPRPAATGYGPGEAAGRSFNAGVLALAVVAVLGTVGAGATLAARRRRS